MATKVDISNFLKSLNQDYLPKARTVIVNAVNEFALAVMGEAQERCPVKTGALKASANLDPATGERLIATISFNTNYAIYVHELLTNHHSQGEAKFLENAMVEYGPKFGGFVLDKLQGAFG